MPDEQKTRKRRANGEESRRRILDAAVEVASERGYEGTSISLVSARSGLPASSIYWHFQDKDELIAAVIERSFGTWLVSMSIPDGDDALERLRKMTARIGKALLDSPDFLRLGLMLALERRPEQPTARTMFLQVRHMAFRNLVDAAHELVPTLDDASVELLATYAMAGADGIFLAKEIGGDFVDIMRLFDLHARAVFDLAANFLTGELSPAISAPTS